MECFQAIGVDCHDRMTAKTRTRTEEGATVMSKCCRRVPVSRDQVPRSDGKEGSAHGSIPGGHQNEEVPSIGGVRVQPDDHRCEQDRVRDCCEQSTGPGAERRGTHC